MKVECVTQIDLTPTVRRQARARRQRMRYWAIAMVGYSLILVTAYVSVQSGYASDASELAVKREQMDQHLDQSQLAISSLRRQIGQVQWQLTTAMTIIRRSGALAPAGASSSPRGRRFQISWCRPGLSPRRRRNCPITRPGSPRRSHPEDDR